MAKTFSWLRNLSDFLVGSLRTARHFDREDYFRQLADQGFTHVTVNGLGVAQPFESGPPGDVYSWFYDYSPDLDQFVESSLIKGMYPAEYLQANREYLKANASLARKYHLVPGLHICSPRSMPDEFWSKYPFLRGARVDHPRESFRPRYALAMTHPAVQAHYRELVRNILNEVPELGFVHVWTNDSGAGFEFVSSLYAGRNGGPYLIREWKSEDEIARKAAENVLSYFRLLRDEARQVNPDVRVICDLGSFSVERRHIVARLGNGLDVGSFGSFETVETEDERNQLQHVGSIVHEKLDLAGSNIIGFPFPILVYERLKEAANSGRQWLLVNATPRSLAPYDINGEVLKAYQQEPISDIQNVLHEAADRWVGQYAGTLVDLWNLADRAVRLFPPGVPYCTFAFPWFRLWVRPFVPNIDLIPEKRRAYYERFLVATFNNPARVDLNNDMLWNFLTVKEAGEKRESIDREVLPPLDQAVGIARSLLTAVPPSRPERAVFQDLSDRLTAGRCFYVTLRNLTAWIEAVHGYREAKSEVDKQTYLSKSRAMAAHELDNTRSLLQLWEQSDVDWISISTGGESAHIYGENFGELLKNKIELMERHMNDEPYIDPNFMWRMPAGES